MVCPLISSLPIHSRTQTCLSLHLLRLLLTMMATADAHALKTMSEVSAILGQRCDLIGNLLLCV